jgi:hypothetical protein
VASLYPLSACPVPRACSPPPAAPCVSWARGRLTLPPPPPPPPPPGAAAPLELPPPPCAPVADDFDAPGALRSGAWLPAAGCPAPWLSPAAAHAALSGTHVVFIGDSLLRQLFNRLVWHLRGLEEVVEHFFHAHATYAANATHDALAINRTSLGAGGNDGDDGDDGGIMVVRAPLFVLHFVWAPALEAASLHVARALFAAAGAGGQSSGGSGGSSSARLLRAALVAGLNYWAPPEVSAAEEAARGDGVVAAARGARARLLWAATPRRAGAGDAAHNASDAARNALYRARWAAAARDEAPLRARVLPADAPAASGGFARASDGIHFQCGFEVPWGNPIPASADFVKTPPSGDCRDWHNLNLVMMALALLRADGGGGGGGGGA